MSHTRATVLSMLLLGVSLPASAHISVEQASNSPALKSRDGDAHAQLKNAPCGIAGSKRDANITTYVAGSTVTIKVKEGIAHPGYFRFAFDSDGDDGFKDPVSIKPQLASRGCPCTELGAGCTTANDKCTESDFYNSPEVLPNMDNLEPHTTIVHGKEYTFQVTLPNTPCDNCTLQIIQVMEDPGGHGPFDGNADIYHQCLDLVLTPGAGGTAGTGAAGAAGSAGAAGTGGEAGALAGAGSGAAGVTATAGIGASAGVSGGVAGSAAASAGTVGAAGTSGGAAGTAGADEGGCSAAGASSGQSTWAFVLLALALHAARRRQRHQS